jgi:hypothetical protein
MRIPRRQFLQFTGSVALAAVSRPVLAPRIALADAYPSRPAHLIIGYPPGGSADLTELGASLLPGTPAEFGKLLSDETEKWGKVIKFAGIS